MKKVITKKDIDKMNLTEDEQFLFALAADDINNTQAYGCASTKFFAYGSIIPTETIAYKKAIVYFTMKYMGNNSQMSLDGCLEYLSAIFFTAPALVLRHLKGEETKNDCPFVVYDACGLNTIVKKS